MFRLTCVLTLAVLASGCETMSTKVDLEPVQPVRYAQAAPGARRRAQRQPVPGRQLPPGF